MSCLSWNENDVTVYPKLTFFLLMLMIEKIRTEKKGICLCNIEHMLQWVKSYTRRDAHDVTWKAQRTTVPLVEL